MKKKPKPPGQRQIDVGLSPKESKEKTQRPTRLVGLTIAAAIITAVLIASTIYFQNIKNSYEREIKNIQKTYDSLDKNAVTIEDTKRKRADFYKRRHFLDFPLKYSYSAANVVRKLSLIAAKEIELLEIEIKPANQSLTFWLIGRIKANNKIKAQSEFFEFYRELKQFDDIIKLQSSKVPAQVGSGLKQVELYFTINGEVEAW